MIDFINKNSIKIPVVKSRQVFLVGWMHALKNSEIKKSPKIKYPGFDSVCI